MRIHQITEGIPMNPKSFASSIEQASSKNVLIGLEFEFCVPKPRTPESSMTNLTLSDLFKILDTVDPYEWDSIFDSSKKELYEYYKTGYITWFNEYIVGQYIEALNPEDQQIAMKGVTNTSDTFTACKEFVDYIETTNLPELRKPNASRFFAIGVKVSGDNTSGNYLSFLRNILSVRNIKLFDQLMPIDHPLMYDGNYIASDIESVFGSVVVFDRYHQSDKNMTDWYIEPDTSIKPNFGSFGAEVVSPPLPVTEALDAIKRFYRLAKSKGWYTSAMNSTGLHINVSIPSGVDPLKLALISGDYHVLKQYDRQVSEYARSIERALQTDTSVVNRFDGLTKKLQLAVIPQIAKETMEGHYSSISIAPNGKYISFRHVGGDYFNDLSGVMEVIGRFVRSMIIANDPHMYRNEYLKKLSKIVK